jgi:hypothetical protein
MIYFQNEDDMSRESSPCKSPDTGIEEQATESFHNSEEIGMDNQKFVDGGNPFK